MNSSIYRFLRYRNVMKRYEMIIQSCITIYFNVYQYASIFLFRKYLLKEKENINLMTKS